MLRIGTSEECPYCHRSSEIYISNPKSIWEELVILLLLRPVRCHDCMHRFLRPVFIETPIAPRSVTIRKSIQSAKKDEEKSA
jgi:DNA-directed RNA polymerase subunit RPC12/RpoP